MIRSPSSPRESGCKHSQRAARNVFRKSACRDGFSLLEVIIAGTILVASVMVLSRLAGLGRRHIQAAQRWTQSQWLCQTKMSEILARIEPWESVAQQPLTGYPDWTYSKRFEAIPETNLLEVTVTVRETVPSHSTLARDAETLGGQRRDFSLTRWVRAAPSAGVAFESDNMTNRSTDG